MSFISNVDIYNARVLAAKAVSPYGHTTYNQHVLYNAHINYSIYVDKPVLYNTVDRSAWLYQPSLVRWRHRARGVRESLKMNQEMSQTSADINILDIRQTSVNTFLQQLLSDFDSGVTFQIVNYNWDTDPISADAAVTLIGLNNLSARIEGLKQKVRTLEG